MKKTQRKGAKDRRKPGSSPKGGRRKRLRRVEDRRQAIEAIVDDLRHTLAKVGVQARGPRRGRGYGSGRPEAGGKRHERVPVIQKGLVLPPAARRRWLTPAARGTPREL